MPEMGLERRLKQIGRGYEVPEPFLPGSSGWPGGSAA